MQDYWDVARVWNYRGVQSQRQENNDAAIRFNAAISAEDRLATHVRTVLGYDGIRMRVRLERNKEEDKNPGRAEVDMILVNQNNIYIVEVKNWFGDVYTSGPNDDHWCQCLPHPVNPRLHGEIKDHGDVLGDLKLKTRAFIEQLVNKSGLAAARDLRIPLGAVVPLLVFTHEKVRLDPRTQKRHPHAMTMAEFSQVVGMKDTCWDWCSWACPVTVPSNQMTFSQQMTVLEVIDQLPTWDIITLHNGTVRTGDVIEFVIPEASRRRNKQAEGGGSGGGGGGGAPDVAPLVRREYVASARVTWPGTSLFGLMCTLALGYDRPSLILTLKPGGMFPAEIARANFQLDGAAASSATTGSSGFAGSPMQRRQRPQQQNQRAPQATRMVANANEDEKPAPVARIPLGSQLNEPLSSQNVLHLKFRPAGGREIETIALHHVATLDLSPMHHWADRNEANKRTAAKEQ